MNRTDIDEIIYQLFSTHPFDDKEAVLKKTLMRGIEIGFEVGRALREEIRFNSAGVKIHGSFPKSEYETASDFVRTITEEEK